MNKNFLLSQIFFVLFVFSTSVFVRNTAFAATDIGNAEVVGKIDNFSQSIIGSTVIVKDSASQKTIVTQPIDPAGNYAISLPQGTYDISVVPPTGSGASPVTKHNQEIKGNTVDNFSVPVASKTPLSAQQNSSSSLYIILGVVAAVMSAGIWFLFWRKK